MALISVIQDITERRRLEQAQQDFIAMASHDLLGPVTVLRALAQLLQRRQSYDGTALDAILAQTTRLERMIADLRELVQVQDGNVPMRRTPVDRCHLVAAATERVRVQGTGYRLRLDLPAYPLIGAWEGDRLGQVLDNLLGNAVKYSPPDGEILMRLEVHADEVRVRVSDQGPGIPAALLPPLFERFSRGEHDAEHRGLGLGL